MSEKMIKVVLKTARVYQGSVYLPGDILSVPQSIGQGWVKSGQAELVPEEKVPPAEKDAVK